MRQPLARPPQTTGLQNGQEGENSKKTLRVLLTGGWPRTIVPGGINQENGGRQCASPTATATATATAKAYPWRVCQAGKSSTGSGRVM